MGGFLMYGKAARPRFAAREAIMRVRTALRSATDGALLRRRFRSRNTMKLCPRGMSRQRMSSLR
jgi:hypothetical protein